MMQDPRFSATAAPGVWRGTVTEGPYKVDVVLRRNPRGVQLILPDRSIPKHVCEEVAKKLAVNLNALVNPLELPPRQVEILKLGAASTICHYCLKTAPELPYRCSKCGGLYCSDHRLPETHDCPGGPSQPAAEKVSEPGSPQQKRKRRDAVILQEVPCG